MRSAIQAPIAVTSDGRVLINLIELVDTREAMRGVHAVLGSVAPLFVGVEVTKTELKLLLAHLDDAMAEAVSGVAARRRR